MKNQGIVSSSALVAASFLVGGVATAQTTMQEQAAENFMAADANGDGALTFEEFTAFIDLNAEHDIGRARLVRRFGRYEMAFGRVDRDGDGLVTPTELQEARAANAG